ncbi:RagB/SusD family nutrient uptake outer membrane protein [Flavobacterium sufflavum]|uniref:RagB/SusD family nutrient uptake outer membrane protein n=1 Tax=Flavobacterium sufflavum TaxID=1921138 RepID=A0A437L412_9FLAO|nr:RagB/SusD family nutrient uptake outer membrane protein [Flavobacterium sufflavum]RVT80025.1 RagB/SusD family nutrient uptake outer membrane protein [Flavobacterium sufflavum]
MKNIIKNKTIYILGMLFVLFGCTNDLNIDAKDPNVLLVDDFYSTPESYKEGLAGVYGNLSLTGASGPGSSNISGLDAGTSQYGRGFWNLQELTTDEVKWSWENDPGLRGLNRNSWTSDNVVIRGFFGRCMTEVAFVNEYLRQTSDAKLNSRGVSAELRNEIKTYRAEARFLRALAYYHLMDLFGKAGFVTENDPVGAYQSPEYGRPELFAFIESELTEIIPDLKNPLQNEYARADKAAAWMLLAKIYLNAEVFIGEKKYDQCVSYCKDIIGAGFSLTPVYANNFKADNNTGAARNEIIFPIVSDGVVTQNYGPTTVMVNAQVGSLEQNGADFGVAGWAGGLRVTKQFSQTMLNGDYNDDRNTIISKDRSIEMTSMDNYGTGYITAKWSNKTSTGANGSATEIVDTDFPMFRLADVYLMYAEAVLRGGTGGSLTTAKDYVNLLRSRAHNTKLITVSNLNLDLILNERMVELYGEAHRRQDLIRFGKFTGGTYNWSWKGSVVSGIAISDIYKVFPIPRASIAANPNLKQNTGY